MTKAQILALYAQTCNGYCSAAQREQAHKLLMAEIHKKKQNKERICRQARL